ncbi:MAG: hypothetical protein M1281_12785 [Chloroflexi bacterium]|nr:hypothetical protein [Chloroflexota bacterium]
MTYAEQCDLSGKRGIEELDRKGTFSVIANRTLYDWGKAHKYAIVNTEKCRVDSVHYNLNQARSVLQNLSRAG